MFNNENIQKEICKEYNYEYNCKMINNQEVFFSKEKSKFIFNHIQVLPLGMYFKVLNCNINDVYKIFDYFKNESKGYSRININPLDKNIKLYEIYLNKIGYKIEEQYTHILDLGNSYDDVYKKYNSTRRNECNKNVDNIKMYEVKTEEDFCEYYQVYLDSVTRWGLNNAVYSKKLIMSIINMDNVKLWVFKKNEKIISGIVIVYGQNEAFYWQGATLVNKEYKKDFPVVKLMDYVIKDLYLNNIKYLNMGSSGSLDGVRRFKESFGATKYKYITTEYKTTLFKILEYIKLKFTK